MSTLLYAVPSGGHPHHTHTASVRALEIECRSFTRRVGDFITVKAPVQMARTRIAELAMTGRCNQGHQHGKGCKLDPYDFVLMHDDDLLLQPQFSGDGDHPLVTGNPLDVWHDMMNADPKIGIIGAVYMRERPLMPLVGVSHPEHPSELCHVIHGLPPEPVDVDALGTGFMMIRVSVLEELSDLEDHDGAPPLFRFPLEPTKWGILAVTGEDYDFCKRVKRMGYRVVADPRWQTVHCKERGPLRYDHREWEAGWRHGMPAALAEEYRAACPPTFSMLTLSNGMTVLDHTAEREAEAKRWRARIDGARKAA